LILEGKKMRLQKVQNSNGFSAIETLIAIGFFSMSLLTSVVFFAHANISIKQQAYFETRTRIFQTLIYIMGMPSTLRGSMENDTPTGMLWKSIRGNLGTVPAAPLPIALFLPVVAGDATSVVTSGQLTGPPDNPLYYSLEGGSCSGVSCDPTVYSISIITEFTPICPPAYDYYYGVWSGSINPNGLQISTNCHRAQYIKIFYTFQPAPGVPAELSFAPVSGSIMVSAVLANAGI